MDAPFSAACARNREPILAILRRHFADRSQVLEIGSGTGQHAVYFAQALPHLIWQTSDRTGNHAGILAWLKDAALPNTPPPLVLDVGSGPWPATRHDAVFSANTLHIMSWSEIESLFFALPAVTTADAKLVVYGPFNTGGNFTSPGNAAFDASLRAQAAHMGIRDIEAVERLARNAGFTMIEEVAMPANNRCLAWQRQG
ncbi:MAG TPA: DUF938 domain-containing protein [Rhodanobacteraceae bacterium]|nr:DUF938 domain-containing protein [Rhodanobacteraceae bacterium]